MSTSAPTPAPFPHIPLLYTILFLFYEPISAFGGALLCHFDAPSFLQTMDGNAVYAPSSQIIYNQLGATYVLFAFNEAVLLRVCRDLTVWKVVMAGILMCDVLHLYASWCVMGTDVFVRPWVWRPEDWLAVGTIWAPLVVRIAFLAECGIDTEPETERKKKEKKRV
ncbi:hypothetical protein K504DRAFT_466819 [Pleomassaria siparia CBS 279.74]|uniref:DUF7704 domain-containing protein n=1 Tax=Pleomassaria siparia CBS 279.74 TaxID=1314801 RepID=A0A6G1KCA6_9PLEO|nr:hypothetical protein K504DRAFT_466819 [Pleomassaria siparia CBS 279.74]